MNVDLDLHVRGGLEDLGRVEGEEIVIRIHV